jgi:hypothetical protein
MILLNGKRPWQLPVFDSSDPEGAFQDAKRDYMSLIDLAIGTVVGSGTVPDTRDEEIASLLHSLLDSAEKRTLTQLLGYQDWYVQYPHNLTLASADSNRN